MLFSKFIVPDGLVLLLTVSVPVTVTVLLIQENVSLLMSVYSYVPIPHVSSISLLCRISFPVMRVVPANSMLEFVTVIALKLVVRVEFILLLSMVIFTMVIKLLLTFTAPEKLFVTRILTIFPVRLLNVIPGAPLCIPHSMNSIPSIVRLSIS